MTSIRSLAAALLIIIGGIAPAIAQTAPNWIHGFVPTTAQWNAIFASKQDYLGPSGPALIIGTSVISGGTNQAPLFNNSGVLGNGTISSTWSSFLQGGTGAATRTVQAKLRDTVNLMDFAGVVCDGVNDDGPGAQLAHNTQKRVIYPDSAVCYLATPVVLTGGVFQADGQNTTIKTKAAPMPSGTSPGVDVSWNAFHLTGMSSVRFNNMTIDGNTTPAAIVATNTLGDLRVPIEILDSSNIYFDGMEFTRIKAPFFNYSVPGASATLIPQLKTGQFWIASTTGACQNVTIENVRFRHPTFVEGGSVVNCQNTWVDNFRSYDDVPSSDVGSISTPLAIMGPLASRAWINNAYIKDHRGSAMNLGVSHLKVTNSEVAGPTFYTETVPGFTLTLTTVSGNAATTITSGSCAQVSTGQRITGSGIQGSSTVAGCTGATLTLSLTATASASGVVATLGAGTSDQVRLSGGIDSGEELTYGLFTDQGPVEDLTFIGNTIYGVRDQCIGVGDRSAAVGTFHYSKVVVANNICYDAPVGVRITGVDGYTVAVNHLTDIRAYAYYENPFSVSSYFTGPFEGYGVVYSNSKNFNVHSNSINGGTAASYQGLTASAIQGIKTIDINNALVSVNSVRDFITYNLSATTTVNNTGSDLRFINNAFHGTPTLDMVVGESGLALSRADISGNTRNGVPVLASNSSVFITNLDGVPLGGLVGSEALRVSPAVNQANRIGITGGATGAGPTISAAGSDANVDLILAAQGAGIISTVTKTISIGPGGTTSGDAVLGFFNGANAANGGAYLNLGKNSVTAKAWSIGHASAILTGGSTSDSLIIRSGTFGTVVTIDTAGLTTLSGALSVTGGLGVGTISDPGTGMIYTNSASFMIRTKTSYNDGAAAAAGTLLNAPAAGNPTKWIPVDDNGTTRYVPAW